MKWYKVDCDAQDNLDMRRMVDEWGWDWYGRYWAILGKIGMLVTEKRQTFALQTNNDCPFPVRLLANDLSTTVERLSAFCDFLADNRLIDPEAWKTKNLIYCPKLRERADEYTKKLLTKSRHSPVQEVEVDIEVDKKKSTDRTLRNKPPSLEEMKAYFVERKSTEAEAEKCYDYYTANGWRVGKNPMKDWRAVSRNWLRNNYGTGRTVGGKSAFQQRAEYRVTDNAQHYSDLAESIKGVFSGERPDADTVKTP